MKRAPASRWPLAAVAALAPLLSGCGPVIAGIVAAILVLEDDGEGGGRRPIVAAKSLGLAGGTECEAPASLGANEADPARARARRSGRAEVVFTLEGARRGACVPVSVELLGEDGEPLRSPDGTPIPFRPAGSTDLSCARDGENRILWDTTAIAEPAWVRVRVVPAGGEDRSPPLAVYVDNRPANRLEVSEPRSTSTGPILAGDIEIPFRVVAPRGVAAGDVRDVAVTYAIVEGEGGGPAPAEPKEASVDLAEGLPPVGEEGSVVWHSDLDLPGGFAGKVRLEVFALSYDIACAAIPELAVDNAGLAIRDAVVSSLPAARSPEGLVGLVVLDFAVAYERAAPVDLSVRAALETAGGAVSLDASEVPGFREPGPIATSPEGVRHRFVWNSSRDLDRLRLEGRDVATAVPVSFRVSVRDPATGREAVSTIEAARSVLGDGWVHTVLGGVSESALPLVRGEAIAVGERAGAGASEARAYYLADPESRVVWRVAVPLEALERCGKRRGASCESRIFADFEAVAGRGEPPESCGRWGGEGPAGRAYLSRPEAVAFDEARRLLYVADSACGRIVSVDMSAEERELRPLALVAGAGASGAGAADLGEPRALALSADGARLYVADSAGARILEIPLSGGRASAVAVVAEGWRLRGASGLALSEAAGVLYASKPAEGSVVGVDLATGEIFAAAGTGARPAADETLREGPALSVALCSPAGLSVGSEHGEERLYIAERDAGVVRSAKILSNGTLGALSFAAGAARAGGARCGAPPGACAEIGDEQCLALGALPLGAASHAAVDPEGRLVVADPSCGRLFAAPFSAKASARTACEIAPERVRGPAADAIPGALAAVDSPSGLLARGDGEVWASDAAGRRIVALDRATATARRVAGRPVAKEDVVACGGRKAVRRASDQNVPARDALLGAPGALAEDAAGNVYVADSEAHVVWTIRSKDGRLRRFAGRALGNCAEPGFDAALNAKLRWASSGILAGDVDLDVPSGLAAVAERGVENLYISDARHHRVLRVRLSDKLTVRAAGRGRRYAAEETACASPKFVDPRTADLGDGGPAAEAFLSEPGALAWDGGTNLYVADRANHRIRRIDLGFDPPLIFTVAGTGSDGTLGFPPYCDPGLDPRAEVSTSDPPLALELPIGRPLALAARRGGESGQATHLFFADGARARIWSLDLGSGRIELRAGEDGAEGFAGEGDAPSRARFRAPAALAVDDADSLYVADSGNARVRKFRLDFGEAAFGGDVAVLDDGARGTSSAGYWRRSAGRNPYGTGSLYLRHAEGSYTYDVRLPRPGAYEVFAWWTQYPSRAESVPYAISTAEGETIVTVDQRVRGGQWNRLGAFRFGEAARIQIRARKDGFSYCADAVLLRPAR